MKTDNMLIASARGYMRKRSIKPETPDHDRFTGLIEDYETAAELSRGPNPNRAAYWEVKAVQARRKLANAIEQPEQSAAECCGR